MPFCLWPAHLFENENVILIPREGEDSNTDASSTTACDAALQCYGGTEQALTRPSHVSGSDPVADPDLVLPTPQPFVMVRIGTEDEVVSTIRLSGSKYAQYSYMRTVRGKRRMLYLSQHNFSHL